MPESITKPSTIENFMKANTSLRIGADSIKEFHTNLDIIAVAITNESEKAAKAAGRNTIQPGDVKTAITAVTGSTSDLKHLFKQLEKLNAKSTADLSVMIQNWIDAN